ncbi:MAG: hypothetical protein EBR82_42295 [Caulobacteraceae bacterium]|nr:hypothetical protein [Caulobacteraceae bacterium]
MRSDIIIAVGIALTLVFLALYWEHIQVKKMFAATTNRINKIYDSVKAFLFVHFVESVGETNDIDENLN